MSFFLCRLGFAIGSWVVVTSAFWILNPIVGAVIGVVLAVFVLNMLVFEESHHEFTEVILDNMITALMGAVIEGSQHKITLRKEGGGSHLVCQF